MTPRMGLGRDFATLAWMLARLLACAGRPRKHAKAFHRRAAQRAMSVVGADSLPIVSVIAACTGIILALQAVQQLEKVGALSYAATMVAVILVRELGPLLTAVIVTGRSGAAFAAEIATMQISEEIDALEVMGIDPVRFLVWPKLLAMLVMVPCLTLVANAVGIAAGGVFSTAFLGIDGEAWLSHSLAYLGRQDIIASLTKSLGFAACITIVGCWQGFLARQGAEDVGRRTTKAVVLSIFVIVLLDLFFTGLNYLFR